MKRIISLCLVSLVSFTASAQFSASDKSIKLAVAGIEGVFLTKTLNNAKLNYSSSANLVEFYRYETSPNKPELIPDSDISSTTAGDVTTYSISNLMDMRGYMVEENGKIKTEHTVWVINYGQHLPSLNSITAVANTEDKCTKLNLLIDKSDELHFYNIAGVQSKINRRYNILYTDLKWNDTDNVFDHQTETISEVTIGSEYTIDPSPLINTAFTLQDAYANKLEIAHSISSSEYESTQVEAHIKYEVRDVEKPANQVNSTNDEYNAPVEFDFYAVANEPNTNYYTWYIINEKDPKNYIARYTGKDISYEFNTSGRYTVKLEVANFNSECPQTSTFSLTIRDSFLKIPNFFSPGTTPGQNDEFRVSYKSLTKFKCTIFNRWGNKIYHFTDPAQGWDGKYKGKLVSPGVYFYAIEAEGSDGIKYEEAGDINILRGK